MSDNIGTPEISVIMSVYNGESFLRESIESIISQSFPNWEMLVCDDNSSDASWEILKHINDPRIRIFRNEKNLGLTKNLNRLISLSRAPFIARMDADDVSHPERFQRQLDHLTANPKIWVLGAWCSVINEYGETIGEKRLPKSPSLSQMYKASPLVHPSVMISKRVFEKLSYDETYRTTQDLKLWFDVVVAGGRIENLPEFLIQFRIDNTFYRRRGWKKSLAEFEIYWQGIIRTKGSLIFSIYPLARLLFRLMPTPLKKVGYALNLRSRRLS